MDFSGFYKLPVKDRLAKLREAGKISAEDEKVLLDGDALKMEVADRMVENVVGRFHLPFAVVPGFVVNGKEYVVPMVIEEPSVVAGSANAAKSARESGGFTADADEPIMVGQLQIMNPKSGALAKLEAAKGKIFAKGKEFAVGVERYGGGLKEIRFREVKTSRGKMVLVEFEVDVRDIMGANTVNTIVEGTAPLVQEIIGGTVRLRILSNLAVKRKARAKCTWKKEVIGEAAVEGVLDGYEMAANDVYRCSTHNKGIMNGIDAVAVATGNDWRAVEAGAHSFAALGGYHPLTTYWKDADGNLVGEIELPLAVGTVGGAININPLAQIGQKILGAKSARELSMVMAAVGLAQNFAALRALGMEGISQGHMKLHAKNLAVIAGASTTAEIDKVTEKMKESGVYTVENAKKIFEELKK
ncbi:hydroxymethylglutaryl-CoA reductase, degradative [Candidatus Micrarchaeota archaeon]|nr:hydroxymethylglutaryl-CoA reductase, degradative [Candidatus Micrarchaeota archaeon]